MQKLLFCLCLVALVSCGGKKSQKKTDQEMKGPASVLLNPADFQSKLKSTPNAQLVDVRTPEELKEGYIEGAININYQGADFMDGVAKLDKNKPTFVYCRSGGRSAESCTYMRKQGFKELYELEGGISRWMVKNMPVVKDTVQ